MGQNWPVVKQDVRSVMRDLLWEEDIDYLPEEEPRVVLQ